jgi:hypothetical protein
MRGYHRPPQTKHSAERVRNVLSGYIDENRAQGRFELSRVKIDVNRLLNGGKHEWDTPTDNQIARAAEKMAADGKLIKVGRDHAGPDGMTSYRDVVYYTPEGFEAAKNKHAEEVRAQQAIRERWAAVYDKAVATGLKFTTGGRWEGDNRGEEVQFSLETIEWFLGLRDEPS